MGEPRVIAPIMAAGQLMGYVSIAEGGRRLEELDRLAAEQAGMACAIVLLKEHTTWEVEQRVRGDFLNDLLSGEIPDDAIMLSRAAYLGHDLLTPHRVVIVQGKGAGTDNMVPSPDVSERILKVLSRRSGNHLAARRGEGIVLLIPDDPLISTGNQRVRALISDIERECRQSITHAVISIGVGGRCRELKAYRESYLQATRALTIVSKTGQERPIVWAEDLGIISLLVASDDPAGLLAFAEEVLGPLARQRHGLQDPLLTTLVAYFREDCSVDRTATVLHLHISSVKYRLRRIAELTQMDLSRSEDRFKLQLALKVRQALEAE
jgi:sugar diacid utilization regulator